MSQLFTSDDQNMGVSTSATVLSTSIQFISLKIDWVALLAVQGTLRRLLSTTVQRHQLFALCLIYSPALTTVSDHWEDHSLIIGTFVSRVLFLLFTSGLSLP